MSYVLYNDLHLWPVYLWMTFILFLILACAAIIHELGHIYWFKLKKNRNVKLKFFWKNLFNFGCETGELKDYKDLTAKEYIKLGWAGVLAGFIPIIFLSLFQNWVILMVVPYLSLCWHDIKVIDKAKKEINETWVEE